MKFEPRVYPFETRLKWTGGKLGDLSLEGEKTVRIACPKEFGGPGGEWTPEHLFVASVEVCVMTTFLWLLGKAGLEIVSYESEARGEARQKGSDFLFTRIVLTPHLECKDWETAEKAMDLLKRAHRDCLICKSLDFEVILSPTVEVPEW
jgi:organic hydroperoxide reductase OsmC/OhrA